VYDRQRMHYGGFERDYGVGVRIGGGPRLAVHGGIERWGEESGQGKLKKKVK